jgi:hypothetical protein
VTNDRVETTCPKAVGRLDLRADQHPLAPRLAAPRLVNGRLEFDAASLTGPQCTGIPFGGDSVARKTRNLS